MVLLPLLAGCPLVDPCRTDSECEFCDGETCNTATGLCEVTLPPPCPPDLCDREMAMCAECTDSTGCDDGVFCNGAETCNPATGACVTGGPPCDLAAEECDEAAGTCVTLCGVDADCDDGNVCNGAESCDPNGRCAPGTDLTCEDDGDLCTIENCDPTQGCVAPVLECPITEICLAGFCTHIDPCSLDTDCNDGLFCNGVEFCDPIERTCMTGIPPCAADQACDELLHTCGGCGFGDPFGLTLGTDSGASYRGGDCDDTYDALLIFNPPTGDERDSLQNQDSLDGAGGADTLNAQLHSTNATLTPGIRNIETINITDTRAAPLSVSFTNVTGALEVNSFGSTQTVSIINVPNVVDIGVHNSNASFNVNYVTAATAGANDAMTIRLSNATGGAAGGTQAVTVTSGGINGIETFYVISTGAANHLDSITHPVGQSLTAVNVSGDTRLTVNAPLPGTVTAVDCAANTGGCIVAVGSGNVTYTGGSGDDTCIFGGTDFDGNDTVSGGAGTDTLSLLTADADNAMALVNNVSGLEALTVSDALAGDVNTTFYGAIDFVTLAGGITGGRTLTLTSGATVNFGAREADNDSAGNNVLLIAGPSQNDAVTLHYNDSDSAGDTTLTGIEKVTLHSNVDIIGTPADGGANTFAGAFTLPNVAASTLTILGSEDVTFGGAVTARAVDASAFAHRLTMALNVAGSTANATVASGGVTLTGGTADDSMVGSTSSDALDAGPGHDVVQPGRGIDTVSLGGGSDILDLEDLDVPQALAANRCTVSGFAADGSIFTPTNDPDAIRLGNITSDGDLSDGASAIEWQLFTVPTNVVQNGNASIIELSYEFSSAVDLDADLTGGLLLVACGGTVPPAACTITTSDADEDLVLIAYQSGSAYLYHANGAGGDTNLTGAEIALIAILSGDILAGGLDATQFID